MKPAAKDDPKAILLEEVQTNLGSSPDGLSQAKAQKRLAVCGPNGIDRSPWRTRRPRVRRVRAPRAA